MSERPLGSEPAPLLGVDAQFATGAAATSVLRVAVRNAASEPRVLSVAALGIDPAWVDGAQRTGVLAPGETGTVEFRVTPPLGTLPARYPLILAAQALDPTTGRPTSTSTGSAESVLVVNPRSQLTLEVTPRDLRMIAAKKFTVELRNQGTVRSKVDLLLQSSSGVVFRLPRQLSVPPGKTVKLRGSVRARRPYMVGAKISHSFTLTARGTESVKHVDGQVVQRAAIGPSMLKALMLALVIVVWVGAAVVFIPALAQKVRSSSEESAAASAPGADGEAEAEAAGGAGSGSEEEAGAEGGGGDADAGKKDELQLTGTVGGTAPEDVTVRLEPTSLVDEQAQGGAGVGVDNAALERTGMRLASATVRGKARDREIPERSVVTADDGSWAFPAVRTPGYYLVSFTKPGYQTQRFVVDSSSEAAAEPLEFELAAGQGSMSGRITGPGGKAVGGATITISDGTNTVTTSSNSQGDVGAWAITGLSSPSTYVVTATTHGMSSESRVVTLAAGASGSADLKLVAGVATLTGLVRVPGLQNNKPVGLGGLTVGVDDGKGQVRTATTLTVAGDGRGTYSIPALPAPGNYTVTFSGDGYQSQTRRLSLAAGDAGAVRNVTLNPATGSLSGKVYLGNRRTGLENAAMTLENADHTYKTTSTQTATSTGDYAFSGVAPGTYVLTTRYFGQTTDHVSVKIEAGVPEKSFDRILRPETGSGLPSASSLTGSVIDAQNGQDLAVCARVPDETDVFERCLKAEVDDPGVTRGGKTDPADHYETTFAPNEAYELPDPDTHAGAGLRPGLHTVTVTAPGYESGSVDVRIGQDAPVVAPIMQLNRAPIVTGTISGSAPADPDLFPSPVVDSCVWVLDGVATQDQTDALDDCASSIETGDCAPLSAPYDGSQTSAARGKWCAAVTDTARDFSVQVPKSGRYTLWIEPLNPEWASPPARELDLQAGETEDHDSTLNRYGLLRLTVLAPNDADALVAGTRLPVTVRTGTLASGLTIPDTDATSGTTVVRGLQNLAQYTFGSASTVRVDPNDPEAGYASVTGTVTVNVAFNEIRSETLRLTDKVPYFLGRVRGKFDLDRVNVPGARVVIKAASSFNSNDEPDYPAARIDVRTDKVACFGVRSDEDANRGTTPCHAPTELDLDAPGTPALTGTYWPSGTSHNQTLRTAFANEVTVTADGYDDLHVTRKAFQTKGITDFVLVPSYVDFGATVALSPRPAGAATGGDPTWSDGTVEVIGQPADTGTITAQLQLGSGPREGAITWNDSRAGSTGKVRPGTYQIRVSGVTGWEADTGTLSCRTASTCTWIEPVVLVEQGTVKVTVVDPEGVAVDKAAVTENTSKLRVETPASGVATFRNLSPATGTVADTRTFRVQAPGFRFGTTSATNGPNDVVEMRCAAPGQTGGPRTPLLAIGSGLETSCTITLHERLTTIKGNLTGVLDAEPAQPQDTAPDAATERLGGYEVQLTRCTTGTCVGADLETATTMRQTTPLGAATLGSFTFTGTNEKENLTGGTYLLRATQVPPGYQRPTGPTGGRVIVVAPDVDESSADPDQRRGIRRVDALVYADLVTFDVRVTDQHNRPVTDATVRVARTLEESSTGGRAPNDLSQVANGIYRYTGMLPGRWYVRATADGMQTTSYSLNTVSSGGSVVDFKVTRTAAKVSGTTYVTPTTALGGVVVTLTCRTDGSKPPAAAGCRGSAPALSTTGDELRTTTAESGSGRPTGSYSFGSVPAGDYVITFTKPGHTTYTDAALTLADEQQKTIDPQMPIVVRDVRVQVQPSHSAPELSGLKVELRPMPGTVAPIQQTTPDSTYVAQFSQVPSGCWEVVVLPPSGHRGTAGTVSGSPNVPELGCPAGTTLQVPAVSDTAPLELTVPFAESLLAFSQRVQTSWSGHVPPTPTYTVTRVGGPALSLTVTATSGRLWLPPGTYDVAFGLPTGEDAFWTLPSTQRVELLPSTTPPLEFVVEEKDFEVTVSIPSLPAGETGRILISPGDGQTASYPYDADEFDLAVPPTDPLAGGTSGGSLRVTLPRGNWIIRGSWSTGPDGDEFDIQGPRTVTLGNAVP